MDKNDLLLYAVTDRSWLPEGETLEEQVEKCLKGGATCIQLREKHLSEEEFLEEARRMKAVCAKYHVPLLINDNVEIALAVDADGVHVGQSVLYPPEAHEAGRRQKHEHGVYEHRDSVFFKPAFHRRQPSAMRTSVPDSMGLLEVVMT